MRRGPEIRLEPLAAAVMEAQRPDPDEVDDAVTSAILDAAAAVLAEGGLRGATVEDIAARGQLGRTTIYRRFSGRDELVHAVLAREVQRAFRAITDAVAHLDRFEDRVIEGLLAGLRAARRSPLLPLVRSEPDLLRLVTVEAGPLLTTAADLLVAEHQRLSGEAPTPAARHTAELLVRFGTSLLLAPESTLPLDDEAAARAALHGLFDPLLGSA